MVLESWMKRSRFAGCLWLGLALACTGSTDAPVADERPLDDRLDVAIPSLEDVQELEPDELQDAQTAARERVEIQGAAVEQATDAVGHARQALESAEISLVEARGELEAARQALRETTEQIRKLAVPDPELFRIVQKKLLDAPALGDVAIAAEVETGSVALFGRVPDAHTRDAAEEIARSVLGVTGVDNQIEVAEESGRDEEPREIEL